MTRLYRLDDEVIELEKLLNEKDKDATLFTGGCNSIENERKVKDREYYDLLNISTNATANQIKKGYYKEARKVHPDKCPNDPEAASKFQAIGTAYQTLSDEKSRASYDKNGKPSETNSGVEMEMIDPYVFFAIMFGSHLVEPYVGELWIASTADNILKDAKVAKFQQQMQDMNEVGTDTAKDACDVATRAAGGSEEVQLKQRRREVKCALHLRSRIKAFVEKKETKEEFVNSVKKEAEEIAKGTFGGLYLTSIGFALDLEAEEYLGFCNSFLGIDGHIARTKKNVDALSGTFQTVGTLFRVGWQVTQAFQDVESAQSKPIVNNGVIMEKTEQQKKADETAQALVAAKKFEESIPVVVELAWTINGQDIKKTLKDACSKLFQDRAVSKEIRKRRAEAIGILARTFDSIGKASKTNTTTFESSDMKARTEVAVMTTMAKAQGQEISDDDTEHLIQQAKNMAAVQATTNR